MFCNVPKAAVSKIPFVKALVVLKLPLNETVFQLPEFAGK